MTLPPPSAVIFDMDGTTVRHSNPVLLHYLERLDDAAYKTRSLAAIAARKLGVNGFHLPRRRKTTRKPRLLVHRTIHKIRRKPVEQIVQPCPGIIDLLELLRTHHIPIGLISNGLGKGYGHDILTKFGLEHLFAHTLFREDIQKSKPDPESIITMITRIGGHLGANDVVWYIGDRAKDIRAALSASPLVAPKIVPIGYGLHSTVALLEHHLPIENLVLSYEDWYDTVDALISKKSA